MNCKWYQLPIRFEAKGSCDNPVTNRDKRLRDIQPDMVCDECAIHPIFTVFGVMLIVGVPLYLAFSVISKNE